MEIAEKVEKKKKNRFIFFMYLTWHHLYFIYVAAMHDSHDNDFSWN